MNQTTNTPDRISSCVYGVKGWGSYYPLLFLIFFSFLLYSFHLFPFGHLDIAWQKFSEPILPIAFTETARQGSPLPWKVSGIAIMRCSCLLVTVYSTSSGSVTPDLPPSPYQLPLHFSMNLSRLLTARKLPMEFSFPSMNFNILFSTSAWLGPLYKFTGVSDGKESTCSVGYQSLIPGWGRSPGEGTGHPLQDSCLENPVDRGAWQATVHRVQRVGHDWVTNTHTHTHTHFSPPPVERQYCEHCGFLISMSNLKKFPLKMHSFAWVLIHCNSLNFQRDYNPLPSYN